MDAGRLDKRVTFRRREKVVPPGTDTGTGIGSRGGYIDLFTVAGDFRPLSAKAMVEAGSLTDGLEATLVVRDTPRTRGLTIADRAVIGARDYAIASVPPSDRSGWLALKLSRQKAAQ